MTGADRWALFRRYRCDLPELGFSLDASRMELEASFLERLAAPLQQAFAAIRAQTAELETCQHSAPESDSSAPLLAAACAGLSSWPLSFRLWKRARSGNRVGSASRN